MAAKVRSDPYDEHREAEEGGLRQKIETKSEDDDDAWHQVFIFTWGGACVALHSNKKNGQLDFSVVNLWI